MFGVGLRRPHPEAEQSTVHFPEPAAFVSEAARVLKPGGTFALVDNVSPDAAIMPGLDRAALRDAAVVYNQFEKLRDPSHGRALQTAEWLELVGDAGLEVAAWRVLVKPMEFGAWVERMQCAPATRARLASMLEPAAPDGSDPGAGTDLLPRFLMPRQDGEGLWISLRELVLAARKSGSS